MKQITAPYRSSGFIKGSTDSRPHWHLDVPKEEKLKLIEIIHDLERIGFKCAIDQVLISIGGPQRKDIPWMYDLHNVPGDIEGGETLGAFSSMVIKNIDEFISVIKSITPKLTKIKGGIIEAEQPVGLYNKNGWKLLLPQSDYIRPIKLDKIGLIVEPSMRFETHHWFSVPKNGSPPVDLHQLNRFLMDNGVKTIGGLFILDGETTWGYASNSFSNDEDFRQRIEKEQYIYQLFLEQKKLQCEDLESLVESIIFVGKTDI